MDASLSFANASEFKDLVMELDIKDPELRAVVINMYPVNRIDSTGAHMLQEIIEDCRRNHVDVYLAGVKGPPRDVLERAGVIDLLGPQHLFHEVHDAVEIASDAVENVGGREEVPAHETEAVPS
jgi:SulP family sulfate permease